MNGLSRLLIRNLLLCLAAQVLIWLPWIQAANSTLPPMESLLWSTILASLGMVLLFALHVLVQVHKNRRRQDRSARPR